MHRIQNMHNTKNINITLCLTTSLSLNEYNYLLFIVCIVNSYMN